VCSHGVRDRLKKILNRDVQQPLLDICVGDEVERDIDGASLLTIASTYLSTICTSRQIFGDKARR